MPRGDRVGRKQRNRYMGRKWKREGRQGARHAFRKSWKKKDAGWMERSGGSRLWWQSRIRPVIGLRVALHILLLLQAAHPLNVEGVEPSIVGSLVRRQLLVAGLEAIAAVFTNADHDHLGGSLSRGILLFGEGDANLGDRAGWGAGRVVHEAAFLVTDHHGVSPVGGDCHAAVVSRDLAIVYGQYGLFHSLTLTAEDEKAGNQSESEQNENQERDEEVDHGGGEAIIAAGITTSDEARKNIGHIGGRVGVFVELAVDSSGGVVVDGRRLIVDSIASRMGGEKNRDRR